MYYFSVHFFDSNLLSSGRKKKQNYSEIKMVEISYISFILITTLANFNTSKKWLQKNLCIHITYSVTGSSGLEGEIESDMVVAVRHRDVPGDLTRSSTCNKTNAIRLLTKLRLVSLAGLDDDSNRTLQFLKIHCSDLRTVSHRNRQEKTRRRREPVEFFARYLLPSMGNRATGRTDMSSRHHARQSTRVIHCISELSKAPFFFSYLWCSRSNDRKVRLCRYIAGHIYIYFLKID